MLSACVCPAFQFLKQLIDFHEIWCKCCPWRTLQSPYFDFPTITNNNIADERRCEVEATLAPLIL